MDDKVMAIAALRAAQDSANWAYWSMIGTWLAGFATAAAVIVSLYIAKMRPKPYIKGEITLSARKIGSWQKGIGISVANIGQMPVNISSMVWHFSGDLSFMHDFAPGSHSLPKRLEHGESAFFFIENDDEITWAKDVKKFILENNGDIKKLRMAVNLASMDRFFIKPAKEVISEIENS
ncbi:hypothetical protein [Klebsiella aerogenes]|uniref:hypothetical protein n=1 Tax=Klebsiella aerogenes TaxID=548 RepID=UPI0012DF6B46|nr:hypothetical protein [Klebsiella aerogenes]HED2522059.1 hypothetical protein [Klebsiella aerogenes]